MLSTCAMLYKDGGMAGDDDNAEEQLQNVSLVGIRQS